MQRSWPASKSTKCSASILQVLGTTGVGKSSAVTLLLARAPGGAVRICACCCWTCTTSMAAALASSRWCSVPTISSCRSGSTISTKWSTCCSAAGPAWKKKPTFCRECIPLAKSAYARQAAGRANIRAGEVGIARYSADVPVPYRISDLIELLDARMGKLENRSSRMVYHKLITRIETACNDPRYAFMFENANVGGDTMVEILSTLFRLPTNGVPVTILQLAGFPSPYRRCRFDGGCCRADPIAAPTVGTISRQRPTEKEQTK